LQRTLDSYDMGIRIFSVKLTGVNVPDAVQDAQRDAIKADKDRQRYQQDAEKYRNDVLPRARGAAAKEVLDAEAYRLQVLALAQGETSRFDQVLAQYEHAPAVTRERMYLETMENVYKNSRKVIVDTKTGNSMMYLPLDKLIAPGPQSITMPNDTMTVPPARVPEVQVAPLEDPRARVGYADAKPSSVCTIGTGGRHSDGARQRVHGQRGAARHQVHRRRNRRLEFPARTAFPDSPGGRGQPLRQAHHHPAVSAGTIPDARAGTAQGGFLREMAHQ
jgi:membrane protease subunit HflK